MRFLSGFCIVACVASAITALELEKVKQKDAAISPKQEKRSLSHDEWSGQGVSGFGGSGGYVSSGAYGGAGLYGGIELQGSTIEAAAAVVPATVGVSSHTDTLTTVREKVPFPVDRPIPYPVDRPYPVVKTVAQPYPVPQPYPVVKTIPQPYPVEVIKHVDRPVPVPHPVHVPVEVIKHVPYEVVKHVDRPYPVPAPYPVPTPVHVPVEVIKHVPVPYPVHHFERPSYTIYKHEHYGHPFHSLKAKLFGGW